MLDRGGARLRHASYLRKWLVLGSVIGVVAGVGAIVFTAALELATRLLLGGLGGYTPPTATGEGGVLGSSGFTRPWAIPLVVGLGGLLGGLLVFRFAPEAEGHGTDAAIAAVHQNPTGIRPRVSGIKIVASALTIGAGGSGGREGPTAQISAGFASVLSRRLDLAPDDARVAVAVGMASGIAAIFRAPLGGAVLGAELLYREDIEASVIVPSFISSIVAFVVFGVVNGFDPIFGNLASYNFHDAEQLPYYLLIGVLAGLFGLAYAYVFQHSMRFWGRLRWPRALKPAAAGVLVGLLGLAIPGVLGTGYGFVQQAMSAAPANLPLWIILAMPAAKILATSLSIGSGGSGGIFGPGMLIGGFLGAGIWHMLHGFAPGLPPDAGPFVIVAMMACFGSIAHAPIAVMLMVAEMTGNLSLLAPAMLAVGIATLIVRDRTIYTSQLRTRSDSAAYRFTYGLPLLSTLRVAEAMSRPRATLPTDLPVPDAVRRLAEQYVPGAPVVDGRGHFRGIVELDTLTADGVDPRNSAGQWADTRASHVAEDATLDAAVEAIAQSERRWVTVLADDQSVVGIVSMSDVLRAYQRALASAGRRLAGLASGTTLFEANVDADSPVAARPIDAIQWPGGTVVVTVQHDGVVHSAHASTVLRPGDTLSVLCHPTRLDEVRRLIAGEHDDSELPTDEPDPPMV